MEEKLKQLRDETMRRAGNASIVANALNISPAAVSQWKWIPYNHVLAIEREFNIPREDMRPDIYPREGK